jgi:hypothetical protein
MDPGLKITMHGAFVIVVEPPDEVGLLGIAAHIALPDQGRDAEFELKVAVERIEIPRQSQDALTA